MSNVSLPLGRTIKIDVTLQVPGLQEEMQVLGEAPLIDLGATTRGRNIPAEEFDVMPKARSFQNLAASSPSVNTGELEGGFQVNGASAGENNFTVDGVLGGEPDPRQPAAGRGLRVPPGSRRSRPRVSRPSTAAPWAASSAR